MALTVYGLPLSEMAVPVGAVLNNLSRRDDVIVRSETGLARVQPVTWSDGSTSDGVKHPGPVWLILGGEKNILVDTGIGDIERIRAIRRQRGDRFYLETGPEWSLEAQLGRHGLRPADIDIVVLTHLHWDHVGGTLQFPKARFVVHPAELPLALTAPAYAPHYFPEIRTQITGILDRLDLVGDHRRIIGGVEVWRLGGHTPGSLAVTVETEVGCVALMNDIIPKYANWEHRWPGPSGNYWNLAELVAAHEFAATHADIVVPGHDWKVWEIHPDGVIGQRRSHRER